MESIFGDEDFNSYSFMENDVHSTSQEMDFVKHINDLFEENTSSSESCSLSNSGT